MLVDDHSNIGIPPRIYHAHQDIDFLVGSFLDQRHFGSSVAGLFFLTCFASLTFPAFHVRSVLLARVVEELNERQTGGAPQMLLFLEEAVLVHRGSAVLDSSAGVLLAVNVLPCEQILQVFQVALLADEQSQCLLPVVSEVFLRLPTGWNSAGHFAVGEFHETPEQAVMLLPTPWRLLSGAEGCQLVGLSSPAFASLFPVAAKEQFVRYHYVLTLSCSSPLAWLP